MERWVIAIGMAVGIVLGIGGGIVTPGPLQTLMWAVSSVGLVVAGPLLALRNVRAGRPIVASGFAVFVVAEMVLWAGGLPGTAGYAASFSAGALFYVPAFLMISLPAGYPIWARLLGAAAAVPFAAHAFIFLTGGTPSEMLQAIGYPVMSAASVGWILHEFRAANATTGATTGTPG
ncbi:MAG TPA: hypothetical protein VI997_10685 [Candidatus Thermoplasmatota archaeon]|nr:hypothetical protein [Candidatus Thermoplasmatota archaeon]